MSLWFKIILIQFLVSWCSGNNGLQKPKRSLVIVFDVTGSMSDEINALREGVLYLMDHFANQKDNPIENYIFVQFRDDHSDPELIPIFSDSDYANVKSKLETFGINNGNNRDCLESCYSGIKRGLDVANDDSIFFVFTDAGTKKPEMLPDIYKLMQRKRITFYFFLTEGCSSSSEMAGDYLPLAVKSNGMFFEVDYTQINKIFPNYRSLISENSSLGTTESGNRGRSTFEIAIDESLREFTFTVSATNPTLVIIDANNNRVPESRIEYLTNLPNIKMIRVKDPISGLWKVEMETSSKYISQISIKSDLQFKYGFSVKPPESYSETNSYPEINKDTYLAIQPSNFSLIGELEYVMLVTEDGEKHKHNLQRIKSTAGDFYLTKPFQFPRKAFKVHLHGTDPTKHIINRLITQSIVGGVAEKPDTQIIPKITVPEGEPIYLICGTISAVEVTTSWVKLGFDYPITVLKSQKSQQSKILNYTIESAELSDSGNYVCKAENAIGVNDASISEVLVHPVPLRVVVGHKRNDTIAGTKEVELTCIVEPKTKSVSVMWMFNGHAVLPSGSYMNGTNLILKNIDGTFSGTYTCVATKFSEKMSGEVQMNVQYQPKILQIQNRTSNTAIDVTKPLEIIEGINSNIDCLYDSNPRPHITKWTNKIGNVVSNRTILTLKGTDEEQAGPYTCQIENSIGRDDRMINIEIIRKPRVQSTLNVEHNIKLGESIQIECPLEVFDKDKTTITWYHNDSLLNANLIQDDKLNLVTTTHDSNGIYKCIAENKAGQAHAQFRLIVNYEPSILKVELTSDNGTRALDPNEDTIEIFNIDEIRLNCHANGNPKPTVEWTKDGVTLTVNSEVIVATSNNDSSGKYTCQVENAYGRYNKMINIEIIRKPRVQSTFNVKHNIKLGESIQIECPLEVFDKDKTTITWYHNDSLLNANLIQDDKVNLVTTTHDSNGIYKCIAENKAGQAHAQFRLIVNYEPSILKVELTSDTGTRALDPNEDTIEIFNIDEIRLNCHANGNPKPTVEWTKDGVTLTVNSEVIVATSNNDSSGKYTCQVENAYGRYNKMINIEIIRKPRVQSTFNVEHNIKLGESIQIECPLEVFDKDKTTITWYHNDSLLNANLIQDDKVNLVTTTHDSNGIYKCIAENKAGQAHAQFRLIVNYEPSILKVELTSDTGTRALDPNEDTIEIFNIDEIRLNCHANGNPKPTVEWTKDGVTLSVNSEVIVATSQVGSSGTYICSVQNSLNSAQKQISLNIIEKPKLQIGYVSSYNLTEYMPFRMNCPLQQGDYEVTWFLNGKSLNNFQQSDNSISIDSVDPTSMKGNGFCIGRNKAGSVQANFEFQILRAPYQLSATTLNKITLKINETLRIACKAFGYPDPIIFWTKNKQHYKNGSALIIDNIQSNDMANYTCTAENMLGQQEQRFEVIVQYPPRILSTAIFNLISNSTNIKISNFNPTMIGALNEYFVADYKKYVQVNEGDSVSMGCPIEGNPSLVMEWFQNNKNLNFNHKEIRYDHVMAPEVGIFKCSASNALGGLDILYYLNLESQLIDTTRPIEIFDQVAHQFLCIDERTSSKILWINQNNEIVSNTPILNINGSNITQSGVYTCRSEKNFAVFETKIEVSITISPQLIDSFEKSLEANLGSKLALECPLQMIRESKWNIKWFHNNTAIQQNLILNHVLHLTSIDLTDNGKYKCIASNKAGYVEAVLNLNVTYGPAIIEIDKEDDFSVATLNKNENSLNICNVTRFILTCHAMGNPPPTIGWKRGHMEITNTKELAIDVTSHYSGVYECFATNKLGTTSASITIKQIIKPVALSSYSNIVNLELDKPFNMACPIEPGEYNVTWILNGKIIDNFKQADQSLNIKLVKSSMMGDVECIATNKAGFDKAEFYFGILRSPYNIVKSTTSLKHPMRQYGPYASTIYLVENEPYDLTCSAKGNPQPETHWFKHHDQIISKGATLTFSGVSTSDTAIYKCVVVNPYENLSEIFSLLVYSLPKPEENYVVADLDSQRDTRKNGVTVINHVQVPDEYLKVDFQSVVSVQEGDTIALNCNMSGEPTPMYKWYKNGIQLDAEKQAITTVQNASITDSGIYKCIGYNTLGQIKILFYVNVNIPVAIESLTPSQAVFYINEPISIICKVRGNPSPVIMLMGTNYLSTSTINVNKESRKSNNFLQATNGRFFINDNKQIITEDDAAYLDNYSIVTYEFEKGEYVATLNYTLKSAPRGYMDFKCYAEDFQSRNKNPISKSISIKVKTRPYIAPTTNISFILINTLSHRVICPIKGYPTPAIEWFHGNKKLVSTANRKDVLNPQGNSLEIRQPTLADTGEYSCRDSESGLEFKFKIQIHLHEVNLGNVQLNYNFKRTINILKNEMRQLYCSIMSDSGDVYWFEIGSNTLGEKKINLLEKKPVYVSEHATVTGDFSRVLLCSGELSPKYGELFTIIVNEKPTIRSTEDIVEVKLHDKIRLDCSATGSPQPTVRWFRDYGIWHDIAKFNDFRLNDQILYKSIAEYSDIAKYKCVATNAFGSDTKVFSVSVLSESHFYGAWSDWSPCSVTCGNGIETKTRNCINPKCNNAIDTMQRACTMQCPIDGGWSEFGPFSPCSKTCLLLISDESTAKAYRTCSNPESAFGGKHCEGDSFTIENCKVPLCKSIQNTLTYENCKSKHIWQCCPDEYKYNEKKLTCEEIDPCKRTGANAVCDSNTQNCVNTGNKSKDFQCDCKPGFAHKPQNKKRKRSKCWKIKKNYIHP